MPPVTRPGDPPCLYVPDVGNGSPVHALLGGCLCCGKYSCEFNHATGFDILGADLDDRKPEHDPDGTPMDAVPLSFYYKCKTVEEKKEEGMVVREAIYSLLSSDAMFCNHKFMGDPTFEAKLREYWCTKLPEAKVKKYWIPLRIGFKRLLAFHRLECIHAIRDKVLGE